VQLFREYFFFWDQIEFAKFPLKFFKNDIGKESLAAPMVEKHPTKAIFG